MGAAAFHEERISAALTRPRDRGDGIGDRNVPWQPDALGGGQDVGRCGHLQAGALPHRIHRTAQRVLGGGERCHQRLTDACDALEALN